MSAKKLVVRARKLLVPDYRQVGWARDRRVGTTQYLPTHVDELGQLGCSDNY